ncbi:MAG: hypothetical protein A2Y78_11345 [Acidobacteria bacterium RBG_13_68_16]|nr:MAG: hypothetical protein A2Y78_11345 [Acidobacteria bacterium RBG_13_68_16]
MRAYPVPPPRRTFTGIELTARKRFADNWQLLASYLYSRLEGNYDGNFQASTNQVDPNINSAYDYAEFEVNTRGWLTNDRRHQFVLNGTYRFPFGLDLGLSAYYRTGIPVTAMGYDYWYNNWELYLSRRGMWDRTDSEYEMNLHLGYPLKLGGVEINLLLDVFNLIDRQGETARDTRYDLWQVLDVINYETGEVLPPIKKGTPCTSLVSADNAFTCNSVFNTANAWQDPRSVRLGVRITF